MQNKIKAGNSRVCQLLASGENLVLPASTSDHLAPRPDFRSACMLWIIQQQLRVFFKIYFDKKEI